MKEDLQKDKITGMIMDLEDQIDRLRQLVNEPSPYYAEIKALDIKDLATELHLECARWDRVQK